MTTVGAGVGVCVGHVSATHTYTYAKATTHATATTLEPSRSKLLKNCFFNVIASYDGTDVGHKHHIC